MTSVPPGRSRDKPGAVETRGRAIVRAEVGMSIRRVRAGDGLVKALVAVGLLTLVVGGVVAWLRPNPTIPVLVHPGNGR